MEELTVWDLALFIGCDVEYHVSGRIGSLVGVNTKGQCQVLVNEKRQETALISPEDVKPVLRSLDSETEEENKEAQKIHFESLKVNNPGSIQHFAAMTRHYIDKGFDVFRWIERDLAIKEKEKI